jgi:tRNA threonylcarbamoyladenosine biosynthesis protein TsaB
MSGSAVLGIDTATAYLSVAAVADGEPAAEELVAPGDDGRPRHSTEVLPAVERAVAAAGGWDAIGLIAVGVGPGTFTGLRIGVASARALSQSLALPIVGVSSLAALAAGIGELAAAEDRARLAVVDAKRGEAFAALYGAAGEELWEPFVAAPAELGERIAAHGEPVLAAGDGSVRFREQLEAAGAVVAEEGSPAHHVYARHLCEIAAGQQPERPEAIEPIYLRRPDAELWRERDRGSTS